jgi:glycosyltransferase involved in cell wall biosynthesis
LKGLGVSVGKEIQKQGVPHIHTLHDVQLSVPSGLLIHGHEKGGLNSGPLRRMYEKGVTRSIGRPDAVLSPSKFLSDFYKERGMFSHSKMRVLPNPLPPVDSAPRGKRVSGPTRLLYVGQLEKHKGIIQIFDAMEKMGTDVQLHIAGDGALADYVTARASLDPRVHFHGFVSMQYLIKIVKSSDAILVPSLCYENSPTVIYESYKVGVPVIASRIGGIPELIRDGETGILIEPGSVPSLVSAIKRIHEDKDVWWTKTQRIFEHGLRYDIKEYVAELEKIIQEIK